MLVSAQPLPRREKSRYCGSLGVSACLRPHGALGDTRAASIRWNFAPRCQTHMWVRQATWPLLLLLFNQERLSEDAMNFYTYESNPAERPEEVHICNTKGCRAELSDSASVSTNDVPLCSDLEPR